MSEFAWNLSIYSGQKKNVTKTSSLAWNCNMSISFGALKTGFVFWGVFRFAVVSAASLSSFCQVYLRNIFAVTLHKSTHEEFSKPPLPLTSILDDRRIRLSFAFAGHTVCNVCLQHFPYIVTGTSVHTEKFIVQPLLAFQSCFGVIDVPFVFRRHFALWTRTLKYVPKQSIPLNFEHKRYHRFGHVLKYAPKQSITWHFTRTVSNPLAKHHSHYRNKSNRHTTPVKTENAYHIWLHLYCLYYKKSL